MTRGTLPNRDLEAQPNGSVGLRSVVGGTGEVPSVSVPSKNTKNIAAQPRLRVSKNARLRPVAMVQCND